MPAARFALPCTQKAREGGKQGAALGVDVAPVTGPAEQLSMGSRVHVETAPAASQTALHLACALCSASPADLRFIDGGRLVRPYEQYGQGPTHGGHS